VSGRSLEAARAVYGAGLLLAPSPVLDALARSSLDRPAVRVARVLGARHLLQAAVLATHPGPRWRLAGAAVDGAHAASMLALARYSGRPLHRRLAAGNAGTAGLLAVAECAKGLGCRQAGSWDG
jgi:hypothetical protein